jgi:hypothetical protein
MTRDLSAFEQNLVDAMTGSAHDVEPPRFDAPGIIDTEQRRARRRVGLVAVSSVAAAVVAACVATSPTGSGRPQPPVVPVTGVSGTTASPSSASPSLNPSPSPATPQSTAASPTTSAGASTPSNAAVPVWPTTATSSPFQGSVPPVPLLTSIRAAGHPENGYDRISFEFTGQLPGYSAGYVGQPPVLDGSGAAVHLPGTAFLRLTFQSAQAHDANGASTVNAVAGTPIAVGQSELKACVLTGDFEGSVSVVLGLSAPHGFHVGVLTKSATDHVIYVDVAR